MLEPQIIQMKGFRNVVRDSQTTGFQIQVRCPYYRGIWLSLLEDARVTVDGETFSPKRVRCTFGGKTLTSPELAEHSQERWLYEEAATLTVDKPGGLEPGIHNVESPSRGAGHTYPSSFSRLRTFPAGNWCLFSNITHERRLGEIR